MKLAAMILAAVCGEACLHGGRALTTLDPQLQVDKDKANWYHVVCTFAPPHDHTQGPEPSFGQCLCSSILLGLMVPFPLAPSVLSNVCDS